MTTRAIGSYNPVTLVLYLYFDQNIILDKRILKLNYRITFKRGVYFTEQSLGSIKIIAKKINEEIL